MSCVYLYVFLWAATTLAPKPIPTLPRHGYRVHVTDPVTAPVKGVWPDAKPFLGGAPRFNRRVEPETPGPGEAKLLVFV